MGSTMGIGPTICMGLQCEWVLPCDDDDDDDGNDKEEEQNE